MNSISGVQPELMVVLGLVVALAILLLSVPLLDRLPARRKHRRTPRATGLTPELQAWSLESTAQHH